MNQPVGTSRNWWQAVDRRTFGKGVVAFASLAQHERLRIRGGAERRQPSRCNSSTAGTSAPRSAVWYFPARPVQRDAAGSADWQAYTDPTRLIAAWQPQQTALAAVLRAHAHAGAAGGSSLRSQIRPIMSPRMQEAFRRGPDAAAGPAEPGNQRPRRPSSSPTCRGRKRWPSAPAWPPGWTSYRPSTTGRIRKASCAAMTPWPLC